MEKGGLLHNAAVKRLMGRLGAFRSDLRALKETLTNVADATKTTKKPTSDTLQSITNSVAELEAYQPSFRQPLQESPLLDARTSENVEDLCRLIDKAVEAARPMRPPSAYGSPPKSLAELQVAAAATLKSLDEAAKVVAQLTIADRVKEVLHRRKVGKAIVFDDLAENDFPLEADRKDAFEQLVTNAGYFEEAVFDPTQRKIWRKSSSQAERVFTYTTPVLFGLLGLGALWLLSVVTPDDSQLSHRSDLLKGYALVLGGAVLQLLIESTKQSQSDTHPVVPIGDFLDWLHLRWVSLGVSYFHVLVTVVGLRALGIGVSDDQGILLYVAAGFSVDSVAGLFLTRFGTAMASPLDRIKDLARGQPKPA